MDVRVAGHQVDTGEALREHAASPEEMERHRGFIAKLTDALWHRLGDRELTQERSAA